MAAKSPPKCENGQACHGVWVCECIAAILIAFSFLTASPARANDDQVDLLLVLAGDISRSVDERKFNLQRDGYASAIADPRVVRAMTAGPLGRIALCFIEWASENEQIVVIDWRPIAGDSDARDVSQRIRRAPRAFMGRTSISAAIDDSMGRLAHSPFRAPKSVINVSGDGTNNAGREITAARDEAVAQGVTINGLAILSKVPLATNPLHTNPYGGLTAYYENNVIGGPGAFVVEAESFEAFGQLLIGKLIKEIAEVHRPGRNCGWLKGFLPLGACPSSQAKAMIANREQLSRLFVARARAIDSCEVSHAQFCVVAHNSQTGS
jgi:Protein of unknown function (DUF1194)